MRLVVAGIRKFQTRTASLVSLLIAALIVSVEFVLVGFASRAPTTSGSATGLDPDTLRWFLSFPDAFDAVLVILFAYGGLVAMLYVASVSGSEWSWGTLKVAATRGESRTRYVVATFVSLGLVVGVGALITYLAGLVGAALGGSIAGIPLGNPLDGSAILTAAGKFLRCWLALLTLTSLAYAVTMITRSVMAGIGTMVGFFLASALAPALLPLPDFMKTIFMYLPYSAGADAMDITGPRVSQGAETASSSLDPNLAVLVSLAWLVASLAVAAFITERAEIKN